MTVFFFNDTATTEIYTLSLHDALPISGAPAHARGGADGPARAVRHRRAGAPHDGRGAHGGDHRAAEAEVRRRDRHPRSEGPVQRSEEHTSELQSRQYLVCRLLLEKKNL